MIISEIKTSYPYIRYKVKVIHYTDRKSTAIEWVILEAIDKCDTLKAYAGMSIASFFEHIFTISDANLLIRPCLINLYDLGVIRIPEKIYDETDLSLVQMSNLELTEEGKKMQSLGCLPANKSDDIFTVYYDPVSKTLIEAPGQSRIKNATGIEVINTDEIENIEFPSSTILAWLGSVQNDKQKDQLDWLSPTTKIEDINLLESDIFWKNTVKKIELTKGRRWRVRDEESEAIHELSLECADLPCPEEMRDKLGINDPDNEIEKLIPVSDAKTFIANRQRKDDLFCVDEKYYKEIQAVKPQKQNKLRVGFVFGADSFDVSSEEMQLIIHIPDKIGSNVIYRNAETVVRAGTITVCAGNTEKDMALVYIPKEKPSDLSEELLRYIDKYYEQDSSILFALVELGLKERFSEYLERLLEKEDSPDKKAEIIERLNQKCVDYYNKDLMTSAHKEQLIGGEKQKQKKEEKSIEQVL